MVEAFEELKLTVMQSGMNTVKAALVFILGLIVIKLVLNAYDRFSKKSKTDYIILKYLKMCLKIAMMVLLIIITLEMLGISTVSFIAILSAVGAALALALQDSLTNIASGILIIINKPFREGDSIEAGGQYGTVEDVKLFTTTIITTDNKRVTIPNGTITGGKITNYFIEPLRRVDLKISVAYESDFDKVEKALQDLASSDPLIVKSPEPVIGILSLGESSVDYDYKVWCKSEDYWTVYYGLNRKVLDKFADEGIEIPYNKLNVTLSNHAAE